jgi:ferredoxin
VTVAATYKVILRNRGHACIEVGEEEAIIDAVEARGHVLPIGCRYGGCITCAAKLVAGRVVQPGATALNGRQVKAGYILPCVARPREDCTLEVGVESHDELYVNPFAVAPR